LTQAQLSRIEKGAAPEQLSKLIRWAEVPRIPAGILWFKVPGRAHDSFRSVNRDSEPPSVEADLRLARLLMTDGLDLQASQPDARLQSEARRYFDGSIVAFFAETLTRCKADDRAQGPAAALLLMLGILGAIRCHSKDVKPEIRRSLLALGADGAEFCGWSYRDMRRPIAAGLARGGSFTAPYPARIRPLFTFPLRGRKVESGHPHRTDESEPDS